MTGADASARGLCDGDIVKVYNDRGAYLAVAVITDEIIDGVVQTPTGAWYDPIDGVCVNGNPNTVTRDAGTSRLAQGSTGQLCLVEIEKFVGAPPAGRGYAPPQFVVA